MPTRKPWRPGATGGDAGCNGGQALVLLLQHELAGGHLDTGGLAGAPRSAAPICPCRTSLASEVWPGMTEAVAADDRYHLDDPPVRCWPRPGRASAMQPEHASRLAEDSRKPTRMFGR
jgi:hypothetical protein